ncbi:ELM1/GtrOC1 family putative glycosyltransferase [Rickettsia australis]|uniref:Putative nucleoside-diphosphate-sugar epimerase n=1 Tax=Rickettsia australis (strain Cutlack) TaxID=1105110 RepID=H8K8T9_RICAC|nr:ELM1/GtrOC1 family putative glycosyltransferase [Rickettsia australis]AFC71682.1 putative nucleoside-diphosphate-sugar epimerase [Rickettsia australis str. Cutlack]
MKIWVIADDRTGNTNQAIALAEKLTEEYTTIRLEYNCLAKLPNFLLKYYPIHIKSELLQDILAKSLPDIIITAGRRTAVLAFYLKKKLDLLYNVANKKKFVGYTKRSTAAYTLVREDASTGSTHKLPLEASDARGLIKDIKLIQIMHPNLPYNTFDAVILPYHDSSNSQNGIPWLDHMIQKKIKEDWIPRSSRGMTIPINGAINNVTEKCAAANLELQKHYPNLKQFIAVIIGGNNKKFNFNEDEANLFSSLLNKIYTNQQIPFFISFSRRTPQTVKSIIKNNMPASAIIYDPNEEAGYNPYIAMLANAKYIISTADSISMCSEAASSGKPLYIFYPPNFNSSKHKIFVKQLVEQKIARIFDESVISLEEYNYKPLNEAERVAEILKSLTKSW